MGDGIKDNEVKKTLKEIEDFETERKNLDYSIELNKKRLISKIKKGLGPQIKEKWSRPEKMKISRITRFKRWLLKNFR